MYCTHCGEHNPRGSTQCGQCGTALAPPPGRGTPNGRRCPMCMAVNTPEASFCAACGARVVPLEDLDEAELDFLRPPEPPAPKLSPEAEMALALERQRELFATGEDKPVDPAVARTLATPGASPRPRGLFGRESTGGDESGLNWLDALRGDTAGPAPSPPPAA
ncbi:MAG TPA: zinc ribbon domain-containing protein, partial [Chloroflexia bacterium]|nr:zinc ribbon domain-containing protein [Chloroflexia bacterium]